ncbi:hypothetical protein WM40_08885 [Robbsia andropogonis]|uniref:Uncharacterized protein n=2 Tax=Robbsia andropogonis TaxID=28092 RepID=A0A0F5K1E6_9BURK|nr:hypothetical protein [Robbsia andropogonis]KKB63923.1 hypothetical protein WM40_08885 [Robbsia andropogonis]MCP1116553.1 hypothetical protein [Robbsia andropogonis]MCP1126768.1 hypothetical protein [Robbsia andropogonis]
MQSGNFFEWLGNLLGSILRTIVHLLTATVGGLGHALHEFTHGFADALGIHASAVNILFLVVGVLFLVAGVRSLLARSFIGGIIWLVLAALILGNLIAY